MSSYQVFGTQPEGNKIAADEVSPNHFRIPLVVERTWHVRETPDRPWGPTAYCRIGTGSFPGVKR